jgi:glycosyltransferase involved in cell wall biosynthesis
MKIGIDARTLNVLGGSKTYASNLLLNIKKRDDIILFGVNKFQDYKCVGEKLNQQNPIFRLYYDYIKLPFLLRKYKIDIFHGLKGIIPSTINCKKVVTVHDIGGFVYPKFSTFKNKVYWGIISTKCIKNSDYIISISKSTEKDIIQFLGEDSDKITCIYEGYNNKIFMKKDRKKSLRRISLFLKQKNIEAINIINKNIILNINTISPRKNIINIIKSFNNVADKDDNAILIISGKKGWKYNDVFKEYNKSPFKNKIFFLDYVPDNIISDLYNISSIFIYPSFYEGFGLPILEAQACGCPVITSNVSSMPEVAGKGAILVNPYNINEISKAMRNVLTDKELKYKLIKEGFKNIKRFSWKKCARETLNVYKKIYNEI